jgi:hypothetical protein
MARRSREADLEYQRQYRAANKEKVLKKQREYRARTAEKQREYVRRARKRHRKAMNERTRRWREKNRDYGVQRARKDLDFRLRISLGARIRAALKNGYKGAGTMELIGCSIDELKSHIERQFRLGMTWETWGRHGWHIDHIKPLSSFDLTVPAQQQAACHYTNLQPLWAAENIAKGARCS